MMTASPAIPLVEAAMRLSLSWSRTWRLMLAGELRGEKRGGTRWYVRVEDVDRLLRAKHEEPADTQGQLSRRSERNAAKRDASIPRPTPPGDH